MYFFQTIFIYVKKLYEFTNQKKTTHNFPVATILAMTIDLSSLSSARGLKICFIWWREKSTECLHKHATLQSGWLVYYFELWKVECRLPELH